MRTLICILFLIFYSASFNAYIYCLDSGQFSIKEMKLWYNYMTFIMLLFVFLDEFKTRLRGHHKSLNTVCKLSLLINYILIILTHHGMLINPTYNFLIYNGSVLAVTVMVFISGTQYEYFKNK